MADETQANGEMPQGEQGEQAAEFNFDAWLGEQPEHVRKGYESHTAKLTGALKREREDRQELYKQVKDLLPKAEKGTELERALNETSSRAEQLERKAAFFEEASRPEIGCSNSQAAFLVAKAGDLFTKRGDPDWQAIKAAAPELFARKTAPGHAGNGTQQSPAQAGGMNAYIRAATGRN